MKSKAINYGEIPIYSASVALSEATAKGIITPEAQTWIENRADEFMRALQTGLALSPQKDGTFVIEPLNREELEEVKIEEDEDGVLTLGGVN